MEKQLRNQLRISDKNFYFRLVLTWLVLTSRVGLTSSRAENNFGNILGSSTGGVEWTGYRTQSTKSRGLTSLKKVIIL